MNSRFETAKRGEKRFQELMTGEFSNTERALPVKSLQVGLSDEEVTFEIVAKSQLPAFSFKDFIKSLIKVHLLTLLVFPVFFFVFETWTKPEITSVEIIFILMGIIFTYAAVQLRIDRRDYESGYDRLRSLKDMSYLRRGMISVKEAKAWEQRMAGFAIGFGMIPMVLEWKRIIVFVLAVMGIIIADRLGSANRNRLIRDLSLSLVAGPLLAYGILPNLQSIGFGIVWSFLIFYSLQIDHFENYFEQTKSGEKNFLNQVSFDFVGGRLWKTWSTFILAFSVWNMWREGLSVWIGTVLILFFSSWQWRKQLLSLKSSVGSEIKKVSFVAHQMIVLLILLWVAELVFRAWIAPLVFVWAD